MANTNSSKKVLFVVSSHDQLGDTGRKTGFWLGELTAPYYLLQEAGIQLDIASPNGGQPPIDPTSETPRFDSESRRRFYEDAAFKKHLSETLKLSDVKAEDYDGVFYTGGHGALFGLANNQDSINLITDFVTQKKPVGAICLGTSVLLKIEINGEPLMKGKGVTGMSNSEQESVGVAQAVPFLVEDEMNKLGAKYSSVKDFEAHVVVDGLVVTGQNPASAEPISHAFLKLLQK